MHPKVEASLANGLV